MTKLLFWVPRSGPFETLSWVSRAYFVNLYSFTPLPLYWILSSPPTCCNGRKWLKQTNKQELLFKMKCNNALQQIGCGSLTKTLNFCCLAPSMGCYKILWEFYIGFLREGIPFYILLINQSKFSLRINRNLVLKVY